MKRKWLAWSVVPVLLVLFYGCPKKKPQTPPPPPMTTEKVTPPPVEEPKEMPPPDMQEKNPLESEDLQEVNRAFAQMGFKTDIYFDFDKSDLRPEARDALATDAQMLRDHPEFQLTIEGHCDERGTNEYNIALGDRRANAARDYLGSLGISGDRLRTISYGEERPVCTEHSEECWQRNRRDHMYVSGRVGH